VAENARRALLDGLIDYAGLFPPARLPMGEAVAGYRAASEGAHAWLLDRFVCPASRTGELHAAPAGDDGAWPVAVVVDGTDLGDVSGLAGALSRVVAAFDGTHRVDTVEVRVPVEQNAADAARSIEALSGIARDAGVPASARCFVEIQLGDATDQLLDALAGDGLAAKVRCGGASPAPPPAALARFVTGCAARDLSWKATAGLHHPFRHVDPASGDAQHGFLNLLAASGLAAAGAEGADVAAALADDDVAAFTLDEAGLGWRGHTIGAEARRRFDGYGSCSFDEPVEDLIGLGALSAEATRSA
jgi:hypothetical protein